MSSRKSWRDAATLIIAAKSQKSTSGCDYRILCMKRSAKTAFLSNNISYPGGATEEEDQASGWFDYFMKFGITRKNLETLTSNYHRERKGNAFIFQERDDELREGKLSRGVSLRISAIRETFEELGVLLCRKSYNSVISRPKSSHFIRGIDVMWYQKQVHDRKMTFLQLCEQLNVFPDIFSLYEWSAWLTPTFFSARRFETAFFLCTLDEQPPVTPEVNEAYSYFWRTPDEYIQMLRQDLIWYHPPQFYEFARLCNFKNLQKLSEFAANRDSMGSTLYMPVVFKCSDGMTFILPGDENYPKQPAFVENDPEKRFAMFDGTMEEFREKHKILNRIEMKSPSEVELFSNCLPSNGHLKPVTKFNFAQNDKENSLKTKL